MQENHCENNPQDCVQKCRDFNIKDKEQDIDGEEIPCMESGWEMRTDFVIVDRKMGDAVVQEVQEISKKVCVKYEDWTSFNHTIKLPAKQACALTIKNSFVPAIG